MRAVKRTANKGLKAYMKARYEGLQSIDDMVTRS
jgi:hypothetical protein